EEVGYAFVPLAPRGAVSRPARAAKEGVKTGAKATGRGVIRVLPKRTQEAIKQRQAISKRKGPGRTRRAMQVITGKGKRKRVSVAASRELRPEEFRAGRRERSIEKGIRKLPRKHRRGADDTIAVLAEYGVGRKDPKANLRDIKPSLKDAPDASLHVDRVTTSRAIEYLEKHPELLKEKGLWEAVDAYKTSAREVETAPRAKYMSQARVVAPDVPKPEHAVPMRAREHTTAKTREGAWKDLRDRQKAAKEARRQGKQAALRAQEAARSKTPAGTTRAQHLPRAA